MFSLNNANTLPNRRRVFFSFHYQNDIWRANQVRNSWRYNHELSREAKGFYDASIWENSRRIGPDSLKSLIREGIQNSSVTCVLFGRETYARRWVRYEIARSVIKGNGLLSVKISGLQNGQGYTSIEGPNPLDYMGVYRTDDGRILLAEYNGACWVRYEDYKQYVDWNYTGYWTTPTSRNVVSLSSYARTYCYVHNGGPQNFSNWVHNAASGAGR